MTTGLVLIAIAVAVPGAGFTACLFRARRLSALLMRSTLNVPPGQPGSPS